MTLSSKHAALVAAAGLLTLGACTDPTGANDGFQRTTTGAMIGGVVGAIAGAEMTGDDPLRGAIVGGAIGAGTGAVIGNILDKQAAELRRDFGDNRIQVINTGNELVVRMPSEIVFEVDSAAVRPDLRRDLRVLASNLQRYPASVIEVIGHTDNTGSSSYNQDLSVRRAEAVSFVLVNNGIAPGRVVSIGRGEDAPIASNLTEQGRAQNRRVEIVIRPTR